MRIHRGEKEPAFIDNDVIQALPVWESAQGASAGGFGGVALFLMDRLHRVFLSEAEVDAIIAAASAGQARREAPSIL